MINNKDIIINNQLKKKIDKTYDTGVLSKISNNIDIKVIKTNHDQEEFVLKNNIGSDENIENDYNFSKLSKKEQNKYAHNKKTISDGMKLLKYTDDRMFLLSEKFDL